jgi:hypothetical protein
MQRSSGTARARTIDVPQFVDPRGWLATFEQARPLPFKPVRTFIIGDVPPNAHRAQHAIDCEEFLWMAAGGCRAVVREAAGRDGQDEQQFRLVAHGPGLYLPRSVWVDLYEFSPGSVLVCMADSEYAPRG